MPPVYQGHTNRESGFVGGRETANSHRSKTSGFLRGWSSIDATHDTYVSYIRPYI